MKFFSRVFLAPLARLIFRPKVIGRRNVPKHGGVLLASNHLAFVDSIVITLVARRSVSFMAKSEYFTGRGLRGALSRGFFSGVGAVPVERGVGEAAQNALQSGLDLLAAGEAFSIYPEGTRSRDGRLYRGRTGVAWLALTAGVPVVPVALTGTEQLQPGGRGGIRMAKVTVEFGEPLDLSGFGVGRFGTRPARGDRRGHARDPAHVGPGTRRHLQRAAAHHTARARVKGLRSTAGTALIRGGMVSPPNPGVT